MDTTAIAETRSTALPSAWIDRLFERLGANYGTEKFAALWRGQDIDVVKAVWSRELGALTGEELRGGFERMGRAHPTWPPTVFEFVALCRPIAPTVEPEIAFHEAVRGVEERRNGAMGQWSSRAVYWAMVDVSPFDVANSTWPQIRARWTRALEVRAADPNLPAIPEPPLALPAPPKDGETNAEGLQRLHEMIARAPKVGPRAWATAILERHAAGDKTLYPIAVAMAKDAERVASGGTPRSHA